MLCIKFGVRSLYGKEKESNFDEFQAQDLDQAAKQDWIGFKQASVAWMRCVIRLWIGWRGLFLNSVESSKQ